MIDLTAATNAMVDTVWAATKDVKTVIDKALLGVLNADRSS